jgi:hypothetical protein
MRNGFARARRFLLVTWLAALPWVLTGACGSDDDKPPPLKTGTGGTQPRPDASSGTGGADADTDASDAAGGAEAAPDGPANCGEVVCRGHGQCLLVGNMPACVCDAGYKLEGDTCVVDESCIKIRHLEDGCRQLLRGAPAVATFFAVDYCAGTAVLPEKLPAAFKILENGQPLGSESAATVIPHSVENYVTIAVDVSGSVTTKIGQLGGQLRTFVQSLAGQTPPVGVSVLVFGRFVEEYVPFTTNLAAVDAKLDEMQRSPGTVQDKVRPDGTALYEATKRAIRSTERIQELRDTVTEGGVLSTGVAVVVTDGKETTNETLDTALIRDTLVNVISIGISSDIDDADLTAIGRDGSFLAPLPEDMTQAFTEITQRVKEAPQRAYLMGYCSPATTGTPTVEVTLDGVAVQQTAACKFNADLFGTGAGDTCTLDLFTQACPVGRCGGFLACGACASGQCCHGGVCMAPAATAGDCALQDELCQQTGKVCVKVGTADPSCVDPVGVGEPCSTTAHCAPRSAYCAPVDGGGSVCAPVTLIEEQPCANESGQPEAEVCPTLNCARRAPKNITEPHICRPPAQMFDLCSGPAAAAVCESGTSCRSGTCQPRNNPLPCSSNLECVSGLCDTAASKLCLLGDACYFSWAEKMDF